MTIDETPIAERLIKARELRGLTTSQLARRLGVRTQTLRNWEETGRITIAFSDP